MATRLTILALILGLFTNFTFAQGEIRGGSLFDKLDRSKTSRLGAGIEEQVQPEVTASLERQGATYTIAIRLELPPGANTYSQNPQFSGQTRISVDQATGLQPLSEVFTPDQSPVSSYDENFGKSVEKLTGTIVWKRQYQLLPSANPSQVAVSGVLTFKLCDGSGCYGKRIPFHADATTIAEPAPLAVIEARPVIQTPTSIGVALTAGTTDRIPRSRARDEVSIGEGPLFVLPSESNPLPGVPSSVENPTGDASEIKYQETVTPRSGTNALPLTLRLSLTPENAPAGSEVTLAITADVEEGWHIFGLVPNPGQIGKPTTFPISAMRNLAPAGDWIADHAPENHQSVIGTSESIHHGQVTWSKKFQVVGSGAYGIDGAIRFQVCEADNCRPGKHMFVLGDSSVTPIDAAAGLDSVATSPPGTSPEISATRIGALEAEKRGEAAHLGWQLLFAFLGGLILNIMPCVLPVLPIKALSFVQQAGESRQRIILLNLAYTGGVVVVFMFLGGLAALAGASWGTLFQTKGFNLVMACAIFSMALSLLGVYEIPIPGFIGAGGGGDHQEGLLSAGITGVTTTLLATPCLGPFMGATLAWMVTQPPAITFLICGTMAVGMSSPYLALGLFPRLLDFIPRPGMWMVRFKELCGFGLLGTVLMLIGSAGDELLFPGLIIMLALGLALWMIGQLAGHGASIRTKGIVYTLALLVVGSSIGWFAWDRSEPHLAWQPFSDEALNSAIKQKKTVLVDFTADWCMTCKQNERFALNRSSTFEFMKEHDVVALMADFTEEDPEMFKWIQAFGQSGVPLTVIFPANRPLDPIMITGVYTNGMLLDNLQAAVDLPPGPEGAIDSTKLVTPDPLTQPETQTAAHPSPSREQMSLK